MLLRELLSECDLLDPVQDLPAADLEITGVETDSRRVKAGFLFIAISGTRRDGHEFIEAAAANGAVAVLCEKAVSSTIPTFRSRAVRRDTSRLAHRFYGEPSHELAVLGVTGTNGKTTTAFLTDSLLRAKFGKSGLIGTIWVDEGHGPLSASHTTPEATALHASLRAMVKSGCFGVSLEISSHGIEQGRTADLELDTLVFTNLTQDHLDYHGSMENYYQAKKALFHQLGSQQSKTKPTAFINLDDSYGERLHRELQAEYPRLRLVTFGFSTEANFRALDIKQSGKGIEFRLDHRGKSYLVKSSMIGLFNVRNILCALASAKEIGLTLREAIKSIEKAQQVPGRLERVSTGTDYHVFVDYAHTPDALENVCRTLKDLEPTRLITVFGCGGDRDRSKRPLMATAASQYSTFCIVTSDNPRTENPVTIIKQVEAGLKGTGHLSLADRETAIKTAIDLAQPNDIVLIAGKGHEDYQIFGTEKTYFDDRVAARNAISSKKGREYIPEKPDFQIPRSER